MIKFSAVYLNSLILKDSHIEKKKEILTKPYEAHILDLVSIIQKLTNYTVMNKKTETSS